jgi:hypothetical protein
LNDVLSIRLAGVCISSRMIAFLFAGSLLLTNISAHASGVVLGSYLDSGNAEKAAVAARSVLQALGKTNEVRVIEGKTSAFQQLSRVVILSADEKDARVLLQDIRFSYPDAWFLVNVPEQGIVRQKALAASGGQEATSFLRASQDQQKIVSGSPVTKEAPRVAMPRTSSGPQTVIGQEAGVDLHRVPIDTFDESEVSVVIDGNVNEEIWRSLPYYDNMLVSVPALLTQPEYGTEIRMFATKKGLYISSIMEQPPELLVKRYSKRDDFLNRDTFGVTIDASGEALVAYWFWVALGDSLSDGKVLPERRFQRDWDGPWLGKSSTTENGWSAEFFLPWSMMNMPQVDGPRTIGFAAKRNLSSSDQSYGWPGYAQSSARFVSALNELEISGVQPRAQVSVIPFAASTYDEVYNEVDNKVGLDLSWKPSPKVEVALTANPDFGAVEADDVVLNLTASETFFPEKRLFFLEGNEVFSTMPRGDFFANYRVALNEDYATTSRQIYLRDFVSTPVSLLNTRRIGGTANQVEVPEGVSLDRGQRDVPTDLLGAAKVTGAVGDVRYGVLGAVEDEALWLGKSLLDSPIEVSGDGRDFGVARLIYENVGDTRRSLGYMGTFVGGPVYDATVHSVDGHFTSGSGKLIADAQIITSERSEEQGYGGVFDLMYNVAPNLSHKFEIDYMDENINFNDLGFLRRNDYGSFRYMLLYNKQRISPQVSNFRMTLTAFQEYNTTKSQVTDSALLWRTSMVLPGRNTLRTGVGLLPARYEDLDSRGNGAYKVETGGWFELALTTDAAKMFSYTAYISSIREDLGDWTHGIWAGVTIRPIDAISFDLDLRYRQRNGWMVYQGGRNFGRFNGDEWQPGFDINWFIAPGHQLRWNLQYVGARADEKGFYKIPVRDGSLVEAEREADSYDFNLGILTTQLRYRWEIAPLTDLFIVYNRGNSINNALSVDAYETPFNDLFSETLEDPIVDTFVAKLRYRFGN